MLIRIVIKKERKYSLIRPFWFVTRVDAFIWASEMVLVGWLLVRLGLEGRMLIFGLLINLCMELGDV